MAHPRTLSEWFGRHLSLPLWYTIRKEQPPAPARERIMSRRVSFVAFVLFALGVAGPVIAPAADAERPKAGPIAHGTDGMVVSGSRPASEVGVAVLRKGGNAVDAAVATAFALAVTWPEAGNIGGGGFLLVRPAGKEPTVFDYREKAPAAATRELFVRHPPTSHRLAGVPGTVAGLALA